ncbi:DUF1707 domain-containing protein [Mycobacterium seoulense]|uniref:DUF1707 SHOCT-like domain-containing protein n=1 Tax=Mycobacterium seoulense TaxID=386911 RepID=UPI003CF7A9B7
MSDDLRASDNDRNRICQALDAALGDGQLSTEEHRERVSAATRATTLGELQALVADLQIHPATEQPASRLHGRRAWIAVTVALVLLAAAIAWGLQGDNPSGPSASTTPTTGSVAAGSSATTTSPPAPPPPRLLTLSGVSGFLAQMRAQFGDTLGYQLNIYQEQAVVERPDTANPHKVVSWLFRDGNWTSVGPEMAVASRLVVGDLSTFDVQAVVSVVQQAPQTLHIYDATQLFLTIESRKDGGLRLQINASDGALSGTIVLAADGTVTDIAPPVH